jgi:hypothetical protein
MTDQNKDKSWRKGFELITKNVRVDATDEGGEEAEQCNCPRPSSNGDGKGRCCFDNRCVNFATQAECVDCWPGCQNQRFQKRNYASLDVLETPGKGFGLFTLEDLPSGYFVSEFLGELISLKELNNRMVDDSTKKHLYMIQLNSKTYIDCRNKGAIGRFINHSCEPNSSIEIWSNKGIIHVGIFTTKEVPTGTELTFDYQWPPSKRAPTKCNCNTPSCRGYLEIYNTKNGKPDIDEVRERRKGLWRSREEAFNSSENTDVSNNKDSLEMKSEIVEVKEEKPQDIEKDPGGENVMYISICIYMCMYGCIYMYM